MGSLYPPIFTGIRTYQLCSKYGIYLVNSERSVVNVSGLVLFMPLFLNASYQSYSDYQKYFKLLRCVPLISLISSVPIRDLVSNRKPIKNLSQRYPKIFSTPYMVISPTVRQTPEWHEFSTLFPNENKSTKTLLCLTSVEYWWAKIRSLPSYEPAFSDPSHSCHNFSYYPYYWSK